MLAWRQNPGPEQSYLTDQCLLSAGPAVHHDMDPQEAHSMNIREHLQQFLYYYIHYFYSLFSVSGQDGDEKNLNIQNEAQCTVIINNCMCYTMLKNQQESSQGCQKSKICAVL